MASCFKPSSETNVGCFHACCDAGLDTTETPECPSALLVQLWWLNDKGRQRSSERPKYLCLSTNFSCVQTVEKFSSVVTSELNKHRVLKPVYYTGTGSYKTWIERKEARTDQMSAPGKSVVRPLWGLLICSHLERTSAPHKLIQHQTLMNGDRN